MASVWYIGRSDTRTITADQWTAAGITGSPTDSVWNAANGWSIPQSSLTLAQRDILDATGGFNTSAPDGPRPGDAVSTTEPDPTPQYLLKQDFNYRGRELEQASWPNHAKSSGRTGKFDSAPGTYNVKPSNFMKTRAAFGRALSGSGLARVTIFGDSKSDTYNGNGPGGHDNQFSKWPFKLRNLVGVPLAGTGFAKFWHAGIYDPRMTLTGTWTNAVAGPYIYSGADGSTLTFDSATTGEKGTVVEFVYMDYQVTEWTVSVDGATSGAGFVTVVNGNTGTTLKKLTITGLSDATHSVKITVVSGTLGFFQGMCIRKSSGLLLDNFAINGGASNMFRPGTVIGNVAKFYSPDPDLVVVPLGINDLTAQGLSIAQVVSNLSGLRSDYPNSDFLLVAEEFTSVDSTLWGQYLADLYDLSDSLDVPLLDLAYRFVSSSVQNSAGLMADTVHQNAAGDSAWARSFANLLSGV